MGYGVDFFANNLQKSQKNANIVLRQCLYTMKSSPYCMLSFYMIDRAYEARTFTVFKIRN